MFDHDRVADLDQCADEPVKSILRAIDDGEMFRAEWPPPSQFGFEFGKHGRIEITAHGDLGVNAVQDDAYVGQQLRVRSTRTQVNVECALGNWHLPIAALDRTARCSYGGAPATIGRDHAVILH